MTLDDAAKVAMGWVQDALKDYPEDEKSGRAILALEKLEEPDRMKEARTVIEDLLLALDLGLAQIEDARTLVGAQNLASKLRDALKEGWG